MGNPYLEPNITHHYQHWRLASVSIFATNTNFPPGFHVGLIGNWPQVIVTGSLLKTYTFKS